MMRRTFKFCWTCPVVFRTTFVILLCSANLEMTAQNQTTDVTWFLPNFTSTPTPSNITPPASGCYHPGYISHGWVNPEPADSPILQIGESVTFDCSENYSLSGPDTITCFFGVWDSSFPPVCVEKCISYMSLTSKQYLVLQSMNATTLLVTCSRNTILIGSSMLLCVEGQWFPDYDQLYCAKPCTNFTAPSGVQVSPAHNTTDEIPHGQSLTMECLYNSSQPSGELRCDDGQWLVQPWDWRCDEPVVPVDCATTLAPVNITCPQPATCQPSYTDLMATKNNTTRLSPTDVEGILDVWCAVNMTKLIGSDTLRCVDGQWFPHYDDVYCANPCYSPNITVLQHEGSGYVAFLPTPLPDIYYWHGDVFSIWCFQVAPPHGTDLEEDTVQAAGGVAGELRCDDGHWSLQPWDWRCDGPATTLPPPLNTTTYSPQPLNSTLLPEENTTCLTTANATSNATMYAASVVIALGSVSGLLLIVVVVMACCLYRIHKINAGTKRMKKSGFRDQLSIFQRPRGTVPPKLPERPSTVGSVGSFHFDDIPKLPGQKIAEEDEARRKREERMQMEIYEQIARKNDMDLPEYIDVFPVQ